ncbi:hypothetical protein Y032_0517g2815 [Ancylostoma ceylanicum]|uniref:Uncharacterized protein n=1 Tax=Ancylostoma ceylanicum TaxID=53326 RepID=A0A016WU66_9BILA|nr:hypothetical protein Y032_0517g2815 [Ancylostoma ceylanicum]
MWPLFKYSIAQTAKYTELQTVVDKGRDRGALFSVSLPSRPAASVQQTTRVPAPRSQPLSTTVWSSLYFEPGSLAFVPHPTDMATSSTNDIQRPSTNRSNQQTQTQQVGFRLWAFSVFFFAPVIRRDILHIG